MEYTIEELKQLHILSKPELEQAVIGLQHIIDTKDGERTLWSLTHLLTAIKSHDNVADRLFTEIDSLIELVEQQDKELETEIKDRRECEKAANIWKKYSEDQELLVIKRETVISEKDTLIESLQSLNRLAINQWEFMDAEDDPVKSMDKVINTLKEAKSLPFLPKDEPVKCDISDCVHVATRRIYPTPNSPIVLCNSCFKLSK